MQVCHTVTPYGVLILEISSLLWRSTWCECWTNPKSCNLDCEMWKALFACLLDFRQSEWNPGPVENDEIAKYYWEFSMFCCFGVKLPCSMSIFNGIS